MGLPLTFELRLEERRTDRVFVSVLVAPDGGEAALIDGVALQLLTSAGDALSTRMVLPIAGAVYQPMLSTVELRTREGGEVPLGCRVQGIAWAGADQLEATLPTDPYTELEVHARGRQVVVGEPDGARVLERLLPEERVRIARDFPWVDEPRVPPEPIAELEVVDNADPHGGCDPEFDRMCGDLGLDDANADFLKELLGDD